MRRKAEDDLTRKCWYNIHIDPFLIAVAKQTNYSIKEEILSQTQLNDLESCSNESIDKRININVYENDMLNSFKYDDHNQDHVLELTLRNRMPEL